MFGIYTETRWQRDSEIDIASLGAMLEFSHLPLQVHPEIKQWAALGIFRPQSNGCFAQIYKRKKAIKKEFPFIKRKRNYL